MELGLQGQEQRQADNLITMINNFNKETYFIHSDTRQKCLKVDCSITILYGWGGN